MPRQVWLDIGINGAFLTRRWEEPEDFMRLTRELGYRYHEFCADVLDPFFSGSRAYQLRTARQIADAAARHGVIITDYYTGAATHRFHGLSHSHPSVRARMRLWIHRAMDIVLALGCDRLGGHWDAFPVEVWTDPRKSELAFRRIIREFRRLASVAKKKGLAALYNEQMYAPSEVPWTLDQGFRFLEQVNRGNSGAPVLLTLDTGHVAGAHYGLAGPDVSYIEWLRRFGAVCEIVHVQQTTPDGSHHWPFAGEYMKAGHVSVAAAVEALHESHALFPGSSLREILAPAQKTYLIVEVIPSTTKTETLLLKELEETAVYLRRHIPEGGLTWSFDV
jgi:hypothetical protein